MKKSEIYVSLLNEGINVWRPVSAEFISDNLYQILGEVPEGEEWQFQPGEIVECKEAELSESKRLVAYKRQT